MAPIVSVVIPTYNEAENLPILLDKLAEEAQANGLGIEALIVDDASPDGTGRIAEDLADQFRPQFSVRVIHRFRKDGLSGAICRGARVASGDYILMMDADNSHDVSYLSRFLAEMDKGADVVIGSRYIDGGKILDWPIHRRLLSVGAIALARVAFGLNIRDPISGFAVYRRGLLESIRYPLNPRAYKFLLEVLVRARPPRVVEIPIVFRDRENGDSKFSIIQLFEYVKLIVALRRERRRKTQAAASIQTDATGPS